MERSQRPEAKLHPLVGPFALALLLGLVGATFGCNGASAYATMDGEALYLRACASCHGPDGRAKNSGNPNYRGKRKDWSAETLLEYIDDPQAYKKTARIPRLGRLYMPPVDRRMPPEARERLVAHVLSLMDALEVE